MPQKPKYILPDLKTTHNVGQNLALLRKKRGWSQSELAEKVGITQALLSHYETGRLSIPVEVIIQLAISLKASADELLGLTNEELSDASVPSRRILQRLKSIELLPPFDQKSLLKTIDNALKGAGVEISD